MKTSILIPLRTTAAGIAMSVLAVTQALALPAGLTAPAAPPAAGEQVILASGDCYAIGMQRAAQEGGTLAKATPEVRDGRQVCVVVIVLPARDGNRGVVITDVIPMG